MVQTRKSAASVQASSTSSETPFSVVSPFLSNENSVQPETPDTSDDGQTKDKLPLPPRKTTQTASVTRSSRKRAASNADDFEDRDSKKTTTKRRYVSKEFYV
ncbi:hypothetical protein SERLA73DRAFT_131726, partial [Serpula lacrymans var. lacrymans S7.3]